MPTRRPVPTKADETRPGDSVAGASGRAAPSTAQQVTSRPTLKRTADNLIKLYDWYVAQQLAGNQILLRKPNGDVVEVTMV